MTATDLVTLIDSAERQIKIALKAAADGQPVDLGNLAPWLDRLCDMALQQQATYAAPGLAVLMARLDQLGALLRQRLETLDARSIEPLHLVPLTEKASGSVAE